jgi:UDP-N-acetylmuramoyl-tripeptide--D-alanyl-D-alanine ligase
MAMTRAGEIAKLCAVAEPNIGLVTNVAPVHLEFFGSLAGIAEAKQELVHGLAPPAVAVLNADDPRVARFGEGFAGRVFRFGVENPADMRAENISDRGCRGCEFDLVAGGHEGSGRARVRLPLPGRHHVANAVAAFAVASLLQIEPGKAGEVFAEFRPAPLRGEIISFAQGFTVVNDVYNSNPRALAAMTEALSRTPDVRRRLIVAGEMKELGPTSPELHRQAGEGMARLGNIDILAGVTGEARHLVEGARAAGFDAARALFFETKEAAADWLAQTLQSGDWVLLKASRGVALETVFDALRAAFAPAAQGKE